MAYTVVVGSVFDKKQFKEGFIKVRIDRQSVYGNRYKLGRDGDRQHVIGLYRQWLKGVLTDNLLVEKEEHKGLINGLVELFCRVRLGNKIYLMCWCKRNGLGKDCHGDVLKDVLVYGNQHLDNTFGKDMVVSKWLVLKCLTEVL